MQSSDSDGSVNTVTQLNEKISDKKTRIKKMGYETDLVCPMQPSLKRPRLDVTNNSNGINLEEELRQFQVLDEVHEDDSDSVNGDDNSDNDDSETDLDDAEIEDMLDAGLPDELKSKKKDAQYQEKSKTVLEEKGHNYFEVLPEGWVQVTHNSGMPLYLHKTARVCTLARPYFLGPGSVRKHEIPIVCVPCLNYRKALDKETSAKKDTSPIPTEVENSTPIDTELDNNEAATSLTKHQSSGESDARRLLLPNAKIETVKENLQTESLSADQLNEYCQKLFHFKTIRVMRFKSWSARRRFTKNKKHIKNLQRPTLPEGTKLITFPVLNADGEATHNSRTKKEWIMNPNGKSSVCILHEYVQHALKKQPSYDFKELENAATPYSATVSINGLKYGTGFGTSKKQAKTEAARETLEILIPAMKKTDGTGDKNGTTGDDTTKLCIFDQIRIEDPRVTDCCARATEPPPYAILANCLQRNFGMGDDKIKCEVNTMKHKKNEFTMTVGKHKVTVMCKNKRDGKQRAAQAILQKLHPHIQTWGSLLRLYGKNSIKSFKEKKQEEQEITVLQSKAAVNQPNFAILNKLQQEMSNLADGFEAVKPIGTFTPSGIDLPSSSGSNLNNFDL